MATLWLKCYTEQEIAVELGVTQQTINNDIASFTKKVTDDNFCKTSSSYQDADFTPPLFNVWTFAKKTNEVSHFGNSEQRIVDNLLYLYTEPFDIVIDPFAGGGSTLDVCKKWLRLSPLDGASKGGSRGYPCGYYGDK